MNITGTEAARMLDIVLAKVLAGKPKGYSIIFTRDQNIYIGILERLAMLGKTFLMVVILMVLERMLFLKLQ